MARPERLEDQPQQEIVGLPTGEDIHDPRQEQVSLT